MKCLKITGGVPLEGEIVVQGSKNAALPVLAACLTGNGTCVLENCPDISDVRDMLEIMKSLGCKIERSGRTICVTVTGQEKSTISGGEAARIRSSILFLGALLGKMKHVVLPLPGGCAIGARPIDFHVEAMRRMGAEIQLEDAIYASCSRLYGTEIHLPLPSVGATENIILAAVQAEGDTVIHNAAREPEIEELCRFLRCRGAEIYRDRRGMIRIRGGKELRPVVYRMRADRIAAGTYLFAAAGTGGTLRLCNVPKGESDALLHVLRRMNVKIRSYSDSLCLHAEGRPEAVPYIETGPYPGFPTDLQSPLMAALCRAKGKSCICETMFECRFQTAYELMKMGARITEKGCCAVIEGSETLHASIVKAGDLRGGAALVIGALQAEGCSVIQNTDYIDRGYENIGRDFRSLGANIRSLDG